MTFEAKLAVTGVDRQPGVIFLEDLQDHIFGFQAITITLNNPSQGASANDVND